MNTITSNPVRAAGASQGRATKSLARHFPLVARTLLGLFLLASGLTGSRGGAVFVRSGSISDC